MAEVSASVSDASTRRAIPVDGIQVATAPLPVPSGSAIRQGVAIGSGDGSANFALVDSSGNLKVDVAAGTLNVTGTLSSNLADATSGYTAKVDSNGKLSTEATAANAALTSVAASTSSVSLLAANASRQGLYIYNDSTVGSGANLRIAFAATASLTAFTAIIPPEGTFKFDSIVYTGAISGIWDAAGGGNARITELT
jgi:hypothetical protein